MYPELKFCYQQEARIEMGVGARSILENSYNDHKSITDV